MNLKAGNTFYFYQHLREIQVGVITNSQGHF